MRGEREKDRRLEKQGFFAPKTRGRGRLLLAAAAAARYHVLRPGSGMSAAKAAKGGIP